MKYKNVNRGLPKTIQWKRKGVEVGFDLGGGINSPLGDKPLTVRNVSKSKKERQTVSTTPIIAMGYRQCLPLIIVQLKGEHCQKLRCHNGVADTLGQIKVHLRKD